MEIVHAVAASSLTLRRSICGTKSVNRRLARRAIPKIEQNQRLRVKTLEIAAQASLWFMGKQVQNSAHWVKDRVMAEVRMQK